jgi:hypothetical protein
MGSNSSSVVISFSIAILLLLTLLLLISYNSKCKVDNVERFENLAEQEHNLIPFSYKEMVDNNPTQGINLPSTDNSRAKLSSVANNANKAADPNKASAGIGNFSPSGNSNEYSPLSGVPESFSNNYTQENFTDASSEDPTTCFKRDRLTTDDLLPKDAANLKWAQVNPSSSGDITDQNFLNAGYHIGVNTVGQSLRNANLQIRSEIPNPQVAVSPWMISTIEPDIRASSFEIGSAPSY